MPRSDQRTMNNLLNDVASRVAAGPQVAAQQQQPRPQGGGSLANRFRQRADELYARPYVPYGAGARQRANELLARSKRGQRAAGQNWDLRQFPDDELRLARTDDNFARDLLRNYDPSFRNRAPTPEDIRAFKLNIDQSAGPRLFGNLQNGQAVPNLDPQLAARIREGFTARIAENQDLARQAQIALHRADRIAPLNPLHTTARTLIEGNNPRESINLGREEIAAAQRTNIPNAMAPYLERASQTPDNYMTQYMQRYQPLMQNFREEARRDFLEHDMPTINRQFAGRGAFHSSARQAALRKAIADKDARITREMRNLTVHGQEQAMKDFNTERGHHLRQAEVAGSAHGAQREANIRAAEALRVNALSGHEATRQQAADLSNMGNIEQRQEQHQRDVQLQEHEREQRHPQEKAMLEAALLNNVPPGSFQMGLSPAASNPPPPNPLTALGGALAQMTGLGMQPQQQPSRTFARGGHVRHGYAAGDSVRKAASELAEIGRHTEGLPEEVEMRQRAQGFNEHRANPMGDYLFSLGTHMLGNLQEDPMKAYAQGSNLGMQAYKSAGAHNLSLKEKEDNTLDKINQTKMYQQQILSKHHANMLQQEEMGRHHRFQESESKRAHDIMSDHYKAKDNMTPSSIGYKKSPTEIKMANDARKDLSRALRMKKELGHLSGLLKDTWSSPTAGAIKNWLPTTNIDNQIAVGTNKLILDMHQGMKNIPRSEEFMKRIETTKPNVRNHPEANKQALSLMQQGADDVLENSIATLLQSGWAPEKIEKQFKIKIPSYLLEEESEEPNHGPENVSQEHGQQTDMVRMISPDGRKLNVPVNEAEHLERLGATIVQ